MFNTAACPLAPAEATVSLDGRMVRVSWNEPVSEDPVLDYQIVFKKKDGSFVEALNFCNGKNEEIIKQKTCLMQMFDVSKFS